VGIVLAKGLAKGLADARADDFNPAGLDPAYAGKGVGEAQHAREREWVRRSRRAGYARGRSPSSFGGGWVGDGA
jgi:hypothetical protein